MMPAFGSHQLQLKFTYPHDMALSYVKPSQARCLLLIVWRNRLPQT